VIELKQPEAAGFLGAKGVRSWFEFTLGSPRSQGPAHFWLRGPWGKVIGKRVRNGWEIRWIATEPVWVSCVLVVRTFADMMRLAKLGPHEATDRYLLALYEAGKQIGVSLAQIGDS
jgi:hypothetical protein